MTRDLTAPSWDVDNDGDGVPDSVWVDLGLPVRTTADGRLYKPLFAILCVDLDGRLNLNAHGSLAQADTSNTATLLYATIAAAQTQTTPPFSGGTLPAARGQGFGPAEINLTAVLGSSYQQVLGTQLVGDKRLPGPLWNELPARRRHEQRRSRCEQLVRVWAEELLGLWTFERQQRRFLRFAARSVRRGGGGPRSSRPAALLRVELPGNTSRYVGFGSSSTSNSPLRMT